MTDEEMRAVELRAYEIWDREGRPHGRHEAHWRQALQELGLDQPHDETRATIAAQVRDWDAAEEQL